MKRKIKYILAGLLGLIGLASIGGRVVNAEEAGGDNTGETSDATTVTMTREYYYDFKNFTTKVDSIVINDSKNINTITLNTKDLPIYTSKSSKQQGCKLTSTISVDANQFKGLWSVEVTYDADSTSTTEGLKIKDSTFLLSNYKKYALITSKLENQTGNLTISDALTSNQKIYISSIAITDTYSVNVAQTSYTQDGSKDVDGYTTRFARFITTVNNASELNDLADAKYQVVYNNLTYNVNAYICDALYDGENVYTTNGITFSVQDDVKYIICTIAYDYKDNGETKKYSGDLTFNIILNGVTIATKTTTLA